MKTVLLHGLGQTAQDWKEVVQQLSISDVDCPELFSSTEDEISYSQILGDLEQRYSEEKEPLRICGLSLGALLAIDFAIRDREFECLSAENGAGWLCGQVGTARAEGVGLPDAPKQQQLEPADPQSA